VVNLATYLALAGKRILVIDLDSQGNATSGFGLDKSGLERSIYDAMIDAVALSELALPTPVQGLRIVPASVALAGAEVELAPVAQRERRLAKLIEGVAPDYDYIFLDCPPSLGLMTINALTAADAALVPLQCEYYALEGLTQLISTINLVRDHLNPSIVLAGVVLTMYDPRTNLSSEVSAEVRKHLGDVVYETVVPRSVRLAEAPSYGLPIALYREDCKGAEAYRALAEEFLRRNGTAERSSAPTAPAVEPHPRVAAPARALEVA
jgi:chromosome partitioning protein